MFTLWNPTDLEIVPLCNFVSLLKYRKAKEKKFYDTKVLLNDVTTTLSLFLF